MATLRVMVARGFPLVPPAELDRCRWARSRRGGFERLGEGGLLQERPPSPSAARPKWPRAAGRGWVGPLREADRVGSWMPRRTARRSLEQAILPPTAWRPRCRGAGSEGSHSLGAGAAAGQDGICSPPLNVSGVVRDAELWPGTGRPSCIGALHCVTKTAPLKEEAAGWMSGGSFGWDTASICQTREVITT